MMRIGLIAMSGTRVCDPELLRLGLTLPGFVERSRTIASLPSLGLLTLAAMTPARHRIEYIEVDDLSQSGDLPDGFDLIAISTFTAQIPEAYELADRCRRSGIPVVMGGLHVTALPEEALEHCDAAVIGEGEPCWPDVIADAEAGRLRPRYGGLDAPFDLRHSPMPAFELLDMDDYNRITIQTSRGCPFRCEFCASSILYTPKYKQKPIDRVLAEIDRVLELWPRPFIEFADDNGLVNKAYWKRLLPELRARQVRWFTETDVSIADDPELLDLLRQAGCQEVLCGLESPVDAGLSHLELKTDWKLGRRPGNLAAVRAIQSHGIRVNGCFIVGLDGHTPAIFDQIYRFTDEADLFDVQVTLPTPFPGTPMYRRLKEAGRLTHDGEWERFTLFDLNFEPTPMSADELCRGFRDLVVRLYSSEFTRKRREGYRSRRRRSA